MIFHYGKDWLTAKKSLQLASGRLKGIIAEDTIQNIKKCHNIVLNISKGDKEVYGVNTGFGPLCNTKISGKDTIQLQTNLLLSHSVGVGDPISKEISKLMLILKVHALSKGRSGISMDILRRIIWHIDEDIIPVVPEQGSVGASGDLAPLSHLFIPLLGEGLVFYKNEIVATKNVLDKEKKAPISLHPKAGLALINGTQFIAAHAVKIIEKLHSNLAHADIIGGMMIEGLLGSKMPFHPELHKTRPYKGNKHVAERLWTFIQGSETNDSHKDCKKVQDPYSLRCMPQVHGASRTAWSHLKEILEIEINSVTDNPIIFSENLSISGGNFHGQPLALPIDYAGLAASELGNISDRRSYLALEGKTEGVPKLLVKSIGLNSGFMILQYTSAAIASENKTLCFPASADSIPTSMGQEDHVSMGSIGARKTLKICINVEKILAVELICAAQAMDFHKPLKSGKFLESIHQVIRNKIPFTKQDRIFAVDINNAIEIIQSGELLRIENEQKFDFEYYKMFEEF